MPESEYKTKSIRQAWYAILLAILLLFPQACNRQGKPPTNYSAEAIAGSIVDARTNLPLSGVVVTANWELKAGKQGELAQFVIMESVTDDNGRYRLAAWGPRPRSQSGTLVSEAPHIVIFKSGYAFQEVQGSGKTRKDHTEVWKSDLSDKTVELRPYGSGVSSAVETNAPFYRAAWLAIRSTWQRMLDALPLGRSVSRNGAARISSGYGEHLDGLRDALRWAYDGKRCEWKSISTMVAAVHLQAKEFRRAGVRSSLPTVDDLIPAVGVPDACGARQFFESYLETQPKETTVPVKIVPLGRGTISTRGARSRD